MGFISRPKGLLKDTAPRPKGLAPNVASRAASPLGHIASRRKDAETQRKKAKWLNVLG